MNFVRRIQIKMKPYYTIVLFSVVACLVGCIHFSSNPSAIQQAESIMNTRPDSALKMLQGMVDSIHAYPEETQMYWHLLTIQAKDKLYITHTNDSLINHIVEFYDNHDDKEKQMLAYYYQGRVYRDINDAPRALKAFQQAEKIRTSDWDLLTKVYSQMGYLFSYQGLYDEAIQVNRKAIELYNQQGQEAKSSYAWRDIARMYDLKGMKDSACVYYRKACDVALTNKDSIRYVGVLSELACLYYEVGKQDTAKQMLLAMVNNPRIRKKTNIYSYLGNVYTNDKLGILRFIIA
jgi:tetratricopeptide (TPR) repeat protein